MNYRILLTILIFFTCLSFFSQEKVQSNKNRLAYLDSVTQSYNALGKLDSLIFYNIEFKKLAIELDDTLSIGIALVNDLLKNVKENRMDDMIRSTHEILDTNMFHNYPKVKAKAYGILSGVYSSQVLFEGNVDSAIFYSKLLVKYSTLSKDSIGVLFGNTLIGRNYEKQGKIDSAFYYYNKCLSQVEKMPFEKNSDIFILYLQVSQFYFHHKSDTVKALDLLDEGLTFSERLLDTLQANDKRAIFSNNKDSALYYRRSNYFKSKQLNSNAYEYIYIKDLGSTFLNYSEYDSAKLYLNKAMDFANFNNFKPSQTYSAKLLLGELYKRKMDFDKAIYWYNEALDHTKGSYNIALINKGLAYSYGKVKNYEKAYTSHIIYQKLKDSIYSVEKTKTITEIEQKYEAEKKELKIKELEDQNTIALQQSKNEKQKNRFYLIGGIALLLLIVIGALIFIRVRNTRFQNREYKLEQQLLRSQMNPHFMSNFLMAVKIAIKKEDSDKAIEYMDKFGVLSRQVLESSINDFITLEEEVSFLNNYLSLQQLVAYSLFDYSITVSKNIDESELMIPPMLIQPFVENSIKHGFLSKQTKGKLEVSFDIKGNYIITKIKDNGQGFNSLKEEAHSKNKSRAMSITKSRIGLLKRKWNKNITFDILSTKSGAEVIFKTPIRVA